MFQFLQLFFLIYWKPALKKWEFPVAYPPMCSLCTGNPLILHGTGMLVLGREENRSTREEPLENKLQTPPTRHQGYM